MDTSYYKKYEPIFGAWTIARELGEGAFGKVFEIQRQDFNHTYRAALKAITIPQNSGEVKSVMADGLDEPSTIAYFRTFVEEMVSEFALMSKLKGNSHVVSYEDHTVIPHEDGIGWDILIRMELLTPLFDYTQAHFMMPADVAQLGIDLCRALELCQKHNIIHRDIKPENIFVSENGDFKLGDFGIARTAEKTTSGLSKKGTYSYMAPEVYKGLPYGPSVDIYSLGIVMYRLLNDNRAPFWPPAPQLITYRIKEDALGRRLAGEALPRPAEGSDALAAAVLKACAYDPKDRYANATEMRIALENALQNGAAAPAKAPSSEYDQTFGMFGDRPDFAIPQEKPIPPKEPAFSPETDFEKTTGMFGDRREFAVPQEKPIPEPVPVQEKPLPPKEPFFSPGTDFEKTTGVFGDRLDFVVPEPKPVPIPAPEPKPAPEPVPEPMPAPTAEEQPAKPQKRSKGLMITFSILTGVFVLLITFLVPALGLLLHIAYFVTLICLLTANKRAKKKQQKAEMSNKP